MPDRISVGSGSCVCLMRVCLMRPVALAWPRELVWGCARSFPRAKRRRTLRPSPPASAIGVRGGGAPKGAATDLPPSDFLAQTAQACVRRRALQRGARRLPAFHLRRFLSPAPCFRAATGALWPPDLAALPPPFVAAASSLALVMPADGSAGASRARGYKPRPRATPPPHVQQCPAERHSRGVAEYRYIIYRNYLKSYLGFFQGPRQPCCEWRDERAIKMPARSAVRFPLAGPEADVAPTFHRVRS